MSNASAHAALSSLARRIGSLRSVVPEISRSSSEPLAELVRAEFPPGVDAYGRAWKPLKAVTLLKGRRNPPLTATGAARDSAKGVAEGGAVRLTIRAYMRYHLSTGRAVFPRNGKAPESWRNAVREANRRIVRKRLGV